MTDEERRKKYLKIFRAEAEEHLAVINRRLLKMEKGHLESDAIHEILRATHTIKGSSRMVGLADIGEIAHNMEDIMKAVESGSLSLEPEIVDRLLEGCDAIARLIEPAGTLSPEEVEAIIARLAAAVSTPAASSPGVQIPPPSSPGTPSSPPEVRPASRPPVEKDPEKAPTSALSSLSEESAPPSPAKSPTMPPPKAEPSSGDSRLKADTIRLPAERLDRLIDYAGELLINKIKLESRVFSAKQLLTSLVEVIAHFESKSQNGNREQFKRLQEIHRRYDDFVRELTDDIIELDLNVQEMHSSSLRLRMIPASTLFDEFPRLVRDLARELGKEIRLEIHGQETELDKRLLEQLRGPLVHLLRNACDHGIEPPEERKKKGKPAEGVIRLQAYHQGASVVIEISDDGAGMNLARIRETAVVRGLLDARAAAEMPDEEVVYLTLRPGFSTSPIITDLSGRGVGLDVVKTNVEALRGDLQIHTQPGAGTRLELRLPLTLALISALLAQEEGEIYALPLSAVEEVLRLRIVELVMERGREMVPVRGRLVPLVRLRDLLGFSPSGETRQELKSAAEFLHIVILKFRHQHLALQVDQALREQEILVKPLGPHLAGAPLVSGATILRKGEPALILNVFDIFAQAERLSGAGLRAEAARREKEFHLPRILVVDDSITTRTIEKNILERAGYEVVATVSAEEALRELEMVSPMFDLFVIDVDMPGMDGFTLTEKLRADPRTADVPVIILTSRASDEDKRRGIEVGAQAYIVKGSFDQTVLLNTVQSLIGG